MKPIHTKALNKAIKLIANGNQSLFAQRVSAASGKPLSQQLVHYWLKNEAPCAARYCVAVEALTGGRVKTHMLNPEDFPLLAHLNIQEAAKPQKKVA